jgi:hypothetical protein
MSHLLAKSDHIAASSTACRNFHDLSNVSARQCERGICERDGEDEEAIHVLSYLLTAVHVQGAVSPAAHRSCYSSTLYMWA